MKTRASTLIDYSIEPNTRIKVVNLTEYHVEKLKKIYRSTGLDADLLDGRVSAERIKVWFADGDRHIEIRPSMADIGKIILTQEVPSRSRTGQKYFHAYLTLAFSYKGNPAKKFDRAMRKAFIR